jgi:hypothetical protein
MRDGEPIGPVLREALGGGDGITILPGRQEPVDHRREIFGAGAHDRAP